MSEHAVVVTDSTAYLPPEVVADLGITVVPLQVALGSESLAEGVEILTAIMQGIPLNTKFPSPNPITVNEQNYRTCSGGPVGSAGRAL